MSVFAEGDAVHLVPSFPRRATHRPKLESGGACLSICRMWMILGPWKVSKVIRACDTTNKTKKDRHDDGSVEDVKKDYSRVCAKTTTTTTTTKG
mmetsp:Transcript_29555/g.48487  ORF Transcript_29555/g.48487 Transcript_29555/m.48487 type:complete len:94 (-) Transcript_29555:1795-2076(-)